MKVLFITKKYKPINGGVEKHIAQVIGQYIKDGHKVDVISQDNIKYPSVKFFGLIYIWIWFFRNRSLN